MNDRISASRRLDTARPLHRSLHRNTPALCPLFRQLTLALAAFALLIAGGSAFAGVTASISGTVKDPSGATVAGASVTVVNDDTGIKQSQHTNAAGFYSFQSLPLGHYTIEVEQPGFRIYRQTGLVLDVNAALVIDVDLKVGEVKEAVEVQSEALHVG